MAWYSDRDLSLDAVATNSFTVVEDIPSVIFPTSDLPSKFTSNTILGNVDVYAMIKKVLTARQLQIFELTYMYGKDQIEIASILHIKQPSVSFILSRALHRIRKKLKGIDTLLSM